MRTRGVFFSLVFWAATAGCACGLRGGRRQQAATRRIVAGGPVGDAIVSDERPVCVYGATEGFTGHVQVYVSTDNSRFLEFDHDGVGSQTEVKCKGPVPPDCALRPEDSAGGVAWDLNHTRSCEGLDCPCDRDISSLDFSYMVDMMQEVTPACESWSLIHPAEESGPMRILLVGLGGGALPAYILSKCPQGTATVESVEYDPRVVEAAENFFGFVVAPGRNEVETDDGGRAVAKRAQAPTYSQKLYDVVLVDCFGDGGQVPNSCKDDAFIQNVKAILKSEGKLIQQIWSPQYEEVIQHYRASFGAANVEGKDIELGVNHLIIATKKQTAGETSGSFTDFAPPAFLSANHY